MHTYIRAPMSEEPNFGIYIFAKVGAMVIHTNILVFSIKAFFE